MTSFDPLLAGAQGFRPTFIHYAMMCMLSLVVVSAFEAVGAILVIAMLILPAATAYLLTNRLRTMITLSLTHAVISTIGGIHLAVWLDCPASACMVIMGSFFFCIAWFIHTQPSQQMNDTHEEEAETLTRSVSS